MKITTDEIHRIKRKMAKLAKGCGLYGKGDACPFGGVCVVSLAVGDRIGANRCPIFEKYVLPGDPELKADFFEALAIENGEASEERKTKVFKKCEVCRESFRAKSNRAKYCDGCRENERKRQARERKQTERMRKG